MQNLAFGNAELLGDLGPDLEHHLAELLEHDVPGVVAELGMVVDRLEIVDLDLVKAVEDPRRSARFSRMDSRLPSPVFGSVWMAWRKLSSSVWPRAFRDC